MVAPGQGPVDFGEPLVANVPAEDTASSTAFRVFQRQPGLGPRIHCPPRLIVDSAGLLLVRIPVFLIFP